MIGDEILDDKDYNVTETAKFLKVTPQTVSNYLRGGELHGEKKGPKNKWYVLGIEIKKIMKKWKLIK